MKKFNKKYSTDNSQDGFHVDINSICITNIHYQYIFYTNVEAKLDASRLHTRMSVFDWMAMSTLIWLVHSSTLQLS